MTDGELPLLLRGKLRLGEMLEINREEGQGRGAAPAVGAAGIKKFALMYNNME
jgi:hypothetical protein